VNSASLSSSCVLVASVLSSVAGWYTSLSSPSSSKMSGTLGGEEGPRPSLASAARDMMTVPGAQQ